MIADRSVLHVKSITRSSGFPSHNPAIYLRMLLLFYPLHGRYELQLVSEPRRELCARMNVQLLIDILDVRVNGFMGYETLGRNLFVA